jgi:tRNA threonylcarbamoyladenosine biosynthesis protein TsaB
VFDDQRLIFGLSEPMERGHQERLAPMAAEVMASATLAFADLSKIAVTVGPGSFTGLRVGLAFAKGLHLATGAPLAGIGTLAALAASVGTRGQIAGAIDARRGLVYVQAFMDGRPSGAPDVVAAVDTACWLASAAPGAWRVAGPGAHLLPSANNIEAVEIATPSLAALGSLGASAPAAADVAPIYLRAPDAKPMAS